jgi:hypothetical protein
MNRLNYVPIMSPKQGEFRAIKELSQEALDRITPLFDIHRISLKGGEKDKTLDKHIETIIKHFKNSWPPEKVFLLDYSLLDLNDRMANGIHPLEYLSKELREANMIFHLTIGLDRDHAYMDVVKSLILENSSVELCLRLLKDDFDDIQEAEIKINQMFSYLEIEPYECHLIVDFKHIEENDIDNIIDLLSEFNQQISFHKWISFVLIASAFPVDMSKIPADSHTSIKRIEINLWQTANRAALLIGRKPKFGDYCIVNPEKPDIDLSRMRAGGKIRYTTGDTWEIIRGHGFHKGEKYKQYHSLSKKLVESDYFLGKDYAWGDMYIEQCALRQVKSGNLTTWIAVDTNHHLTLVGAQIASFDAF